MMMIACLLYTLSKKLDWAFAPVAEAMHDCMASDGPTSSQCLMDRDMWDSYGILYPEVKLFLLISRDSQTDIHYNMNLNNDKAW